MTTKKEVCFVYSKEVGGDPITCESDDGVTQKLYNNSARVCAEFLWKVRGICVKEVSVAPTRDEAIRYAGNVYAISWQSKVSHLYLKKGSV